jgi:hypothetical protein
MQKRGCTIAGSVYQAPQRRFAVHGTLLDCRRDGMKCGWCCTYQRKRRVDRAHLVDENDVGFDGMQTIVNVKGLSTNMSKH